MPSYTQKAKKKAIIYYLENKEKISKIQIAKKFGVHVQSLDSWIKQHLETEGNQVTKPPKKCLKRHSQMKNLY